MQRRGCRLSLACCVWLVAATGCVHRTLTIRTDPPGAQVVLNDQPLGTTPYVGPLEWYGWYRVALTKPGYERIDDHVEIRAPMDLWIPLDLAMELLPFKINDPNVLSYRLVPERPPQDPIPPELRERARELLSQPPVSERPWPDSRLQEPTSPAPPVAPAESTPSSSSKVSPAASSNEGP